MQNLLFVFIAICVATSCGQAPAKPSTAEMPKSNPSSVLYTPDYSFQPLSPEAADAYRDAVEDYYNKHLANTGFNGAILVAKNGQIIFEDYKGFINFKTQEPITENTSFHLASISKTFTGMTVLRLWEQGRIHLDDEVTKYLPSLPYKGITIKMLLSHRSGLPDYLNFMDNLWNKKKKATNEDVLNYMAAHKPKVLASPGRVYHYNNTNFMLLALVIEKITQQPYPQYMRDSVFTPLGLKNTWVFSIKDTANYRPTYIGRWPYPMDHLDCTYGDKNIYSTVRDLFIWDKALYQHTFVKASTLAMAFMPESNEHKTMHNYGLGWHLYFNHGDTIIYHNGKWHGENNNFTRFVQQKATLIILGNRHNSNIFSAKNMGTIFTGKVDESNFEE
ncbi:MAG TPA: serine hydrolase domain-containing protein [Chitinophagaceae bacterium]|nr:serine hydrolase domain-containing protein [Chitinophagaceae bacterium]